MLESQCKRLPHNAGMRARIELHVCQECHKQNQCISFMHKMYLKGLNTTRGYIQINLQHISVQWNQEGCHRIHPQEKAP